MQVSSSESDGVRLDKWLWATRFFKTRRLAADAVRGGKVTINRRKAKPASVVRSGDQLAIRKDGLCHEVRVEQPGARRVSAVAAKEMYSESPESAERREEQMEMQRARIHSVRYDHGRPSKRDRRVMDRFRRRHLPGGAD